MGEWCIQNKLEYAAFTLSIDMHYIESENLLIESFYKSHIDWMLVGLGSFRIDTICSTSRGNGENV